MLRNNSKQSSKRSEYLSRRKECLQWEGFAEKECFKPAGMKEWVGDGIPNNSKHNCWQIKTKTYKILQLNALHKCHQQL